MSDAALLAAVGASDWAAFSAALNAGASPNAESKEHGSALYIAAYTGQTRMVNALIDKGADVAWASPSTGHTAMHIAAEFGKTQAMMALLGVGAQIEARVRG